MLTRDVATDRAITLGQIFFIEDAFMGGVLVDQVHALWPLSYNVHGANLADNTQGGNLPLLRGDLHVLPGIWGG